MLSMVAFVISLAEFDGGCKIILNLMSSEPWRFPGYSATVDRLEPISLSPREMGGHLSIAINAEAFTG
jgi:hypothetical protein